MTKLTDICNHPSPCLCLKCAPKAGTNTSTEAKEILTPIIESETGGKKSEVVSQPLEQPNTNAMIVKTIQGLMTCVNNELEKLPDSPLRTMALDDVGIFESGVLYKLQQEFE